MSTAPAHTSLRSPHAESCGALALQPIGSGDEAALLAIFASTREQEREQFGWPEEQWNAFIRQQFMAQHTQYSTAYANPRDRKSTRLNSSHLVISYAVFCLKKK